MKNPFFNIYLFAFYFVFISIISFNTAQAENNDIKQNKERQEQRKGDTPRPGGGEPLSEVQKTKVISILSEYDASSLTTEDARAINNAFREAGIRRGPGQKEAIEAAGFNPDTIRSLDPPPCEKGQKREGGKRKDNKLKNIDNSISEIKNGEE